MREPPVIRAPFTVLVFGVESGLSRNTMNYPSNSESYFEFSIKGRYNEKECLLFFPQLKDGCYQVDSLIWFIRIQDSGAYFVEDEETIQELKRCHPEFFLNTPELTSEVALLFKPLQDDFQVNLTPQMSALLETLECSINDLFRPELN